MQVPDTLPLLMGQGNDETVSKILSNPDNHADNMILLAKICKVKVKFNRPFTVFVNRRKSIKDVLGYTFGGFFKSGGDLCYYFKSNGRHGQFLPLSLIESYEPALETLDKFKDFKQFRRKFDTFFITEEQIAKLYEETSSQTGNRYTPSDFRAIGPAGKEALRKFLTQFKGISNTDSSTYRRGTFEKDVYYVADGDYTGSGGSTSRDISISHKLGNPFVHYASEYSGTGNGRYGMLVSKSTYLWLEDD